MFVKLFIGIVLVAAVAADSIKFTDCGKHEINEIRFPNCTVRDSVCKIKKTVDSLFEVEFVANQNSKTADYKMVAEFSGIVIDVPNIEKDGCHGHVTCPLVKGQKYSFKYSLNLPKEIPDVQSKMKAVLTGENGIIFCGQMNGRVVD